jgi:hypothetical protein
MSTAIPSITPPRFHDAVTYDFPAELVKAIGQEKIDQMPERTFKDISRIGLLDILKTGPIKGTYGNNQLFIAFAIEIEEGVSVSVIAQEQGGYVYHGEEFVLPDGLYLSRASFIEDYAVIQKLFEGTSKVKVSYPS